MNCVAPLASLFVCRSIALRLRALRPQLKREPLDSCTLPSTVSVFPAIFGLVCGWLVHSRRLAQCGFDSHLDGAPDRRPGFESRPHTLFVPRGPSAMPSPSNKQLSNMRLKLAGLSLLSESE